MKIKKKKMNELYSRFEVKFTMDFFALMTYNHDSNIRTIMIIIIKINKVLITLM